ncbi:MAG: methyltransferase domain-containing protein [Candidatus Ryanbacteria bacterium]|nr:methyltransferase domain-containing protein [Candidatus Ryanbacteria bacterium]
MKNGAVLLGIIVLGIIVAYSVGMLNGRATVANLSQYHGDARIYVGSAISFLHDGALYENENPYRKPPAYSVFLAGVFGEQPLAIWILHICFFIGTLLCMYAIGAKLFEGLFVYVPVLALSFFWGNAVYVFKVGSEAPAIFLLACLVYLGMLVEENHHRSIIVAWSIVLGILILTKPIMLYATPFLLYILFRKRIQDLLVACIIVGCIAGGWAIHNFIERHTYQIEDVGPIMYSRGLISEVPTRDIAAYGLAGITGNYIADFVFPGYAADPLASRVFKSMKRFAAEQSRNGYNDHEVDKILTQEGRGRILRNPFGFFGVAVGGIFELNGPMTLHGLPMTHFLVGSDQWIENSYFVKTFRNITGTQRKLSGLFKIIVIAIIRFLWLMFIALVVYGCALARKRGVLWRPILFLVAYFTFMHALVVVPAEVRFLAPVRPLYMLLAALACREVYKTHIRREMKDYRMSHMGEKKSAQYEDTIYRHGSYDDMVWRAEQPLLLAEVGVLRKAVRKIAYLDFGCGTGRILKLLESKVDDALGVDISESMVALAREKGVRAPIIVGDITREDSIGPKIFQLITVFRVFLNAGPTLSQQMLTVLTPKLDSSGVLIFNMHGNFWSYRIFTKIWFMLRGRRLNTSSYWQTKKMVESHGLMIVRFYGFGFVPKVFYRIFGSQATFVVDRLLAKIPLVKYFSYNLIFVCKTR